MGRQIKNADNDQQYIFTDIIIKETCLRTPESNQRQGSAEHNLNTTDPSYPGTFKMFLPNMFPCLMLILWFFSLSQPQINFKSIHRPKQVTQSTGHP